MEKFTGRSYRARVAPQNGIDRNYDLSIILPFYKKLGMFRKVLPRNARFFERNGIEVVIVVDEPTEESPLVEFIKNYPFINWKVIVNGNEHEWRNPAKALNVGIRNATKDYIMVMSPESELYSDVIHILRQAIESYEGHFACGMKVCAGVDDIVSDHNLDQFEGGPYGSILTKKEHFLNIRGYGEQFDKWGGDDDNLRARLEFYGLKRLLVEQAILIHREEAVAPETRTTFDKSGVAKNLSKTLKQKLITVEDKKRIFYPTSHIINGVDWGTDFARVVYDWQSNPYAAELCEKYLSRFVRYKVGDSGVFRRDYRVIALVQAYNESATICPFLNHLKQFCDGIILLDDGSDDQTFDLAESLNLLAQVQKEHQSFNDLENRNILLNIASFFRCEWIVFIDVDERFDARYADLNAVMQLSNVDVVLFRLVHLWDGEEYYRADYPRSCKGMQAKWRMFRNKGRMQIVTDRRLHFETVPYTDNAYESNILLKHYGMLTKQQRLKKYAFYQKEDVGHDQTTYDHMLDEHVLKALVEDIIL